MPRDPKDWSYLEILAEKPPLVVQVDGREVPARVVKQAIRETEVFIAYDLNGEAETVKVPWVWVLRHINKSQPIYV